MEEKKEKIDFNSLRKLLGKSFKGTLITDDRMSPFFIIINESGYTVNRAVIKKTGGLGYIAEGYYNDIKGCLGKISREKTNTEGKHYTSLDEYMQTWTDNINNLRQLNLEV